MTEQTILKVINYLKDDTKPKWVTSSNLINKIGLKNLQPSELDHLLFTFFQENENAEIRPSSLPSVRTLDVLWGSVSRIKKRDVQDINRQDEQILIDELQRIGDKNMFLSHSFKDTEACFQFAKEAIDWNINCWLAEVEILKNEHINEAVKDAIARLPFFCVFISNNLFDSVWTAKEIEFALRNDREVIGIIYTHNQSYLDNINHEHGNYNSREILRRFFDNHPKVKFLRFPDSEKTIESDLFNSNAIIDWDYLKEESYSNL